MTGVQLIFSKKRSIRGNEQSGEIMYNVRADFDLPTPLVR